MAGGLREGVWVCRGSNDRLLLGQLLKFCFNSGHILVPGIGKQIRLQLTKRFALDAVTNPAQVGKLVSQCLDFSSLLSISA